MDHKSQKYDRQIRLWGEHGQKSLESAKVCLINATAVGTEILKNLILPSIGSFTIIDGKIATGEDVGNNFFLDVQSIGQPRGKCAAQLLGELNEDVSGNYLEEVDPIVLIESNHEILRQFSLIIATDLSEKHLLQLSKICWESKIPLVVAKCVGLIGFLRVVIPEHTVVESHPDNPQSDVRIDRPLPDVEQIALNLDFSKMTSQEIGHVPYLLILYKASKLWKDSHQGSPPKNSKEKEEFKSLVMSLAKPHTDLQNFDEAIANLSKAWIPTRIPSDVKDILEDSKCSKTDSTSENFWILARALKEFVESPEEGNGLLPLRGSVPDMHSDTKSFTTLQTLYQVKAKRDIELITSRVHAILREIGRSEDSIPQEEIKIFCKNASFLRMKRFRSLSDEYTQPKQTLIAQSLENPSSNLAFYVLMRASEQFYEAHKRYPGTIEEFETDVPLLKKFTSNFLQSIEISSNVVADDLILEMCRFGTSELHNIASFIGGVGSQEAIKLITHQFTPLNNTFIFNGINGTASTEEL